MFGRMSKNMNKSIKKVGRRPKMKKGKKKRTPMRRR